MLFSSIPFLYYFLPIVLLLYFVVPKSIKNVVLFLASLFFYSWGEPSYIIIMLISISIAYILGLQIEKALNNPKKARFFMILSVSCSLAFLIFFKYTNFFIDNVRALTNLPIPFLKLSLPIGISFYTFQIISYTIDVYRKTVPAQKSLLDFATYVALFPQLIAGPIVRYSDVAAELSQRTHSMEQVALGCRRFLLGLAKKVLIANLLGEFCNIFRESAAPSVLYYWLYAIAFTLHIYFDFSGYSDMAIGLGHIFGFHFIENFNYPYISKTITEFWRRWHMSLGSWFRDYVYIPLGGSRVGRAKLFRNILVVWALTGFWHGAAWNFIFWGLLFAALLMIEKSFFGNVLKKLPVIFSHIYVLFFVILSFVLFNAASMTELVSDFKCLFGFGSLPISTTETIYYFKSYLILFIIGIIGATPLPSKLVQRIGSTAWGKRILPWLEAPVLAILLLLITAYLVDGSFNPFLYFRF